jgi:hypothetical protein
VYAPMYVNVCLYLRKNIYSFVFTSIYVWMDCRYNLVVDDGLHSIGANLNTLLLALEQLASPVWVVCLEQHFKTHNTHTHTHTGNRRHPEGGQLACD